MTDLYCPDDRTWLTTSPAGAGIDVAALNDACDYARGANTHQLIILHEGRVLAEHCYAGQADATDDVFAVQKAVVSWLVGIAAQRRLIGLDDSLSTYLGPGWTRLPRAAEARVTVRRVLTMTTGMNDSLEAAGEIGETWYYNNIAYNYLKYALCDVAGLDLNTLTQQWLGEPLGWTDSHWVDRTTRLPDGRPLTALLMNAREMARFGLAMQAAGRFAGRAVLDDPVYLRLCVTPGSEANPAWGLCWWINDQTHYCQAFSDRVTPGPFAPRAPADLIGARGANEQRLLIVPSRSLVIARLGGKSPQESGRFDDEFMHRLLKKPQRLLSCESRLQPF